MLLLTFDLKILEHLSIPLKTGHSWNNIELLPTFHSTVIKHCKEDGKISTKCWEWENCSMMDQVGVGSYQSENSSQTKLSSCRPSRQTHLISLKTDISKHVYLMHPNSLHILMFSSLLPLFSPKAAQSRLSKYLHSSSTYLFDQVSSIRQTNNEKSSSQ